MDAKKYLLYRKSAAQAELAVVEKALAELEGAAATPETPETPATTGKAAGKADSKAKASDKKSAKTEPEADDLGADAEGEDDFLNEEAGDEVAEPTLEDVRKIVKDFATKHGKEKALKLLGKFKVTAINDIKKGDYAKVIELAKKHL